MRHLLRPEFLDVRWDAQDLDDLVAYWHALHDRASELHDFSGSPFHAVEIALRGFPRPVAADLRSRVPGGPFSSFPDPDTLHLTTGFLRFDERPPYGLGLGRLHRESFDGLLAEIRLVVASFRDEPTNRPLMRTTLVVVGELDDGELLVKALWTTGTRGWEDPLQWSCPWADQEAFLDGWNEFRETGEPSDGLASKLFTPAWIDRLVVWYLDSYSVPSDGPRGRGIFRRAAWLGGLLGASAAGAAWAAVEGLWLTASLAALPIPFVGWIAWQFVSSECSYFLTGHANFSRAYASLYANDVRIVPLPAEESDQRLNNPWARKYLAELAALGCVRLGVARLNPEVSGRSVMVLHLAPDGATCITLLLTLTGEIGGMETFRAWPAVTGLLAETDFTDGSRLASVNADHQGYRRKWCGPEVRMRVFPGVADPGEFLCEHARAVEAFTAETGARPAPGLCFEDQLRRQNELARLEAEFYRDAPFTWMDTVYHHLGEIRKEYREPRS